MTKTPDSVGGRIRQLRSRREWTQRRLAKRSGVSPTFISEIESGSRNVGSKTLLRVADALGASLDYLVRGEQRQQPEPLEIPPELERAAEDNSWSYRDTAGLLRAGKVVVARRGPAQGQSIEELTKEDWENFYLRLFNETA